jgi:DNA-binding CsgD family transcriptional regulator
MDAFDRQRITHALTAAAVDPARWSEALETAATCTGSRGAVLLPVVGALPIVWATPSMAESVELYVKGGWISRDERYRAIAPFLKQGVATDDDCMPLEARKRSPFYQEFLAACHLTEWAGVRMGRGEWVWNLSLQRAPGQDPFSAPELQWLAKLSNTLDSVVQISAALGLARAEAALNAFDFSERAALLLDRSAHVIRINAAAERLIGEDLQISAGRVHCRDPKSNDLLGRAIKTLLWDPEASTAPPVVLQKVSGGRLVIYPMRLPGLTTSPLSAFHAILVISDTDVTHPAATVTLRDVFDLTAAESRLAVAVASGKDLETFSAERQLSKQTVRNQLKSVFLKTGTNRQAQLTVILSTLIPKK